MAEAESELVAV